MEVCIDTSMKYGERFASVDIGILMCKIMCKKLRIKFLKFYGYIVAREIVI